MKLSIFPEAKALPINTAEKVREAFKTSSPYLPETCNFSDENALIELITSYAWSPAVFNGTRKAENFVSTDLLVYDIDEGLTIDEADIILANLNYCYLILPSPSHTSTNHRFRVIIPLAHSILDLDTFEETWKYGAALLKTVDLQCSDCCRFYFASTLDDGFSDFSKDLLVPIKKPKPIVPEFAGYKPSHNLMIDVTADSKDLIKQIYGKERDKVSEAVDYFIKNAHTGLPGNWVSSLNAFCFSLSLSKVDEDIIMEVCEKLAPEPLDSRDLTQIKKAIRDGKKEL